MATKKLQIVGSMINTDETLTKSGVAADAAAVGSAIDAIEGQIADLLYKTISINSFTNNVGTVELGSTVTSVTLTWSTNKTPKSLTLDGISVGTNLNTYTYSGLNLTSGKSYKLIATDERDVSAEKTTSISFVNGVYYGVISSGTTINNSVILNLTRKLQSSKSTTFTATAGSDQYIIYALPSRYGSPSFNVGGFDGGFNLKTSIDFTNASGYTETYNIYLSDNLGLGTTTVNVN